MQKKGRKCKIARAPKTTHKHQTPFLDCRSNIGWVMSNHDKQAGCRNPCPRAFGLELSTAMSSPNTLANQLIWP